MLYPPDPKYDFDSLTNNLVTLTFVRHPFDRLASAYYDKMILPDWTKVTEKRKPIKPIRNKIIRKYRQTDPETDPSSPTPVEFVQYLLEVFNNLNSTFELDPHFKPQWATCPFCRVDFDFIGKIESMKEDEVIMEEAIGVEVT